MATVIIVMLQPALYAGTIELIPGRKWQLVMWGKMDFTVLWYCEGPWDNTVNTIKLRLNWFLCENVQCMSKGLLIGSRLPTTVLRACFTACTRGFPESGNIFHRFVFDELRSYLRSDFPGDEHGENTRIKCLASAINNNQDKNIWKLLWCMIRRSAAPSQQVGLCYHVTVH